MTGRVLSYRATLKTPRSCPPFGGSQVNGFSISLINVKILGAAVYDLLMTLIGIFGKDVEEAKKALKSKLLLTFVMGSVFFGERALAHTADGFRFVQSWAETMLDGDVWTPNLVDKGFMANKVSEYESYVATDRTYWLNSGLGAAPWPLAQDVMADPIGAMADKDKILEIFRANKRADCDCWSETGLRQHLAASAWVTTALAVVGGELRDKALDDVLSKQMPSGAWAMFAEASKDPQTASTYATVTALMAILAHRDAGLLQGARKTKADAAVQQASRWLVKNYSFTEKGWSDYPNSKEGRSLSLGLTGQTLWVLHKVVPMAQLKRIDATFIERNDLDPKMKEFDISDIAIYFGRNSLDYDNTRYARQPWTLLALQAGYGNYDVKHRVKMRLLMAKALNEKSWDDREEEREYMLLELLIAYREIANAPAEQG
jgi:hypothetical protein